MINEEDAAKHVGLPPEQRCYLTERLARERLAHARREAAGPGEWPVFDEFDYMVEVLAAAEAFGVDELTGWQIPVDNDDRSRDVWRSFRAHATKVSQKLMFTYAGVPTSDPNTVALDAATKEKIRFHLSQVRSIIDNAQMPDWKKQELYDALSVLETEIDKARTRVAAVIDVLGKAWRGDVEAIAGLRQIVMILQEAKSKEDERAKLIPLPEPKLITQSEHKAVVGPPQTPSDGSDFDRPLDDEVPF